MEKTFLTTFCLCLLLVACDSGDEELTADPDTSQGGETTQTETVSDGKWAALADSTTNVLITSYLDKTTGTFWSSPNDVEQGSTYIYWQQAHAMDVILYSYNRIKSSDPELAATYEDYFELWYENDANNYNNDYDDVGDYGGFYNVWTDDMAWICLTLLHMTEFTGVEKYADTAREIFDNYIWTRVASNGNYLCLPWTNREEDSANFNACTNVPSCLVAALLYQKYGVSSYKTKATNLYEFNVYNMPDTERVEEPPLSYTQGTMAEASRVLYHITGKQTYMDMAGKVLYYAYTSDRTTSDGILRSEGESMDQSIFKAVLIPYTVNYILDDDADQTYADAIEELLIQNAETLSDNLDRSTYPYMYANYYWGEAVASDATVSMGAQASGSSLIEGVARLHSEE